MSVVETNIPTSEECSKLRRLAHFNTVSVREAVRAEDRFEIKRYAEGGLGATEKRPAVQNCPEACTQWSARTLASMADSSDSSFRWELLPPGSRARAR